MFPVTIDEARRMANAIARLPEFMIQRRGFHIRGHGLRLCLSQIKSEYIGDAARPGLEGEE
jgi:hypothetical protein